MKIEPLEEYSKSIVHIKILNDNKNPSNFSEKENNPAIKITSTTNYGDKRERSPKNPFSIALANTINNDNQEETNQLNVFDQDLKQNTKLDHFDNLSLPIKLSKVSNHSSNVNDIPQSNDSKELKDKLVEIDPNLQPTKSFEENAKNNSRGSSNRVASEAMSLNKRESNFDSANRGCIKNSEFDDKEVRLGSVMSEEIEWQTIFSERSSTKIMDDNKLIFSKESDKKNLMEIIHENEVDEKKESLPKNLQSSESLYSRDKFLSENEEVNIIEEDLLNLNDTNKNPTNDEDSPSKRNDKQNESIGSINNIEMSPMNAIIERILKLEPKLSSIPIFTDIDEDKDENNLNFIEKLSCERTSMENYNISSIRIDDDNRYDDLINIKGASSDPNRERNNTINPTVTVTGSSGPKSIYESASLIPANDPKSFNKIHKNMSLPKKYEANNRYTSLEEHNQESKIDDCQDKNLLKQADEITNIIIETLLQNEIFFCKNLIPPKNFKAISSVNHLNDSTNSLTNSGVMSFLPNGGQSK